MPGSSTETGEAAPATPGVTAVTDAEAAEETRKLRATFPRWGILFDPLERMWVAVKGSRALVAAHAPGVLAERMAAVSAGADAAEGERTQIWRQDRSGWLAFKPPRK
jgi:hypothetical protein